MKDETHVGGKLYVCNGDGTFCIQDAATNDENDKLLVGWSGKSWWCAYRLLEGADFLGEIFAGKLRSDLILAN